MSLFKTQVFNAGGQPIIGLWIGSGRYVNAQGTLADAMVWKSMALANGRMMQGFMDGMLLRALDLSIVFTLVNFNQNLKTGDKFKVQVSGAFDDCQIYDVVLNAPPLILSGRISAVETQPSTRPLPVPSQQGEYYRQQMENWMNNQAIGLPGN